MRLFPAVLYLGLVLVNAEFTSDMFRDRPRPSSHPLLSKLFGVILEHPKIIEHSFARRTVHRRAAVQLSQLWQQKSQFCPMCKQIVPMAKQIAESVKFEDIRESAVLTCIQLVQQENPDTKADIICPGTIDLQGPHVLKILKDNRSNENNICSNLNLCLDPVPTAQSQTKKGKPAAPNLNNVHVKSGPELGHFHPRSRNRHKHNSGVVTFVQLADIHIDQKYAVGSPTDCGLPVCCHESSVGKGSAGVHGAYGCNTPQRTVEAFLAKVAAMDPKPDFIIYTGDNPPHDMWEETIDSQYNCTQLVVESFQRTLGHFPIYSALRNHEMYPTNFYSPLDLEFTYELNDKLEEWWGKLVNFTEDQRTTVRQGAYYSMPSVIPGLRILVINSNYWYDFNFYSVLNEGGTDEKQMKQFIVDTLTKARNDSEKVLLVAHHPSGSLIHTRGRWYTDLVLEYSDVIVLQIAGHTHHDMFHLFTDSAGRAKHVHFTSPSMTSRSAEGPVNPGMRVFFLDATTFELIDYDQYHLDLQDAEASIKLGYSAKAEYGMTDLTPASMQDFVERMKTDEALFNKWYRRRGSEALRDECSATRRTELFCEASHSSYDAIVRCAEEAGKEQ